MSGNSERPKKSKVIYFDDSFVRSLAESVGIGTLLNYQDFTGIILKEGDSLQIQFEFETEQDEDEEDVGEF